MSKVKDNFFTDKEPDDGFEPDPEYDVPRITTTGQPVKTEDIGKLAAALAKAQGELVNVEKKHEGYQGRYKFADLGQVLDVIRPVFSKHGLAFTQLVGDAADGRVSITTMLIHESGQTLQTTSSMALHKQTGLSDAQAAGAVITYLRRYQITAMAGIAQEDTDAAIEEKPERAKSAPKAARPDPDLVRALLACKDLKTLQEMWAKLTKDQHRIYEGVKEQRKAELQTLEADKQQEDL